MPKFNVTLKSPTTDQRRILTGTFRSEDEAVARALAQELSYVDYDLAKDPYLTGTPPVAADAEPVEDVKPQKAPTIKQLLNQGFEVHENGKVTGPDLRLRGKIAMHLQDEPYKIESVEPLVLPASEFSRAVADLTVLHGDPEAWQRMLDELRERGIPMGAVTAFIYGVPIKNHWSGANVIDWDTDTIKCSLHTVTYSAAQDTDDFWNDATNEITGTGYTAGGTTLTASAPTYDTASDQIRLDATDAQWTTSTLTARQAVVYKSTGTSTTSPVLVNVNFGADVSTTAGTFQITWDATGVLVWDVT